MVTPVGKAGLDVIASPAVAKDNEYVVEPIISSPKLALSACVRSISPVNNSAPEYWTHEKHFFERWSWMLLQLMHVH